MSKFKIINLLTGAVYKSKESFNKVSEAQIAGFKAKQNLIKTILSDTGSTPVLKVETF